MWEMKVVNIIHFRYVIVIRKWEKGEKKKEKRKKGSQHFSNLLPLAFVFVPSSSGSSQGRWVDS